LTWHLITSFASWMFYAYSWSPVVIMISAILMGIVSSMDMPARRKILAEIADGRGVGTTIASLDLITSMTSIPGPMIAGFLYNYVGVLGIFWIGSLINLVGALFLLKIRG